MILYDFHMVLYGVIWFYMLLYGFYMILYGFGVSFWFFGGGLYFPEFMFFHRALCVGDPKDHLSQSQSPNIVIWR